MRSSRWAGLGKAGGGRLWALRCLPHPATHQVLCVARSAALLSAYRCQPVLPCVLLQRVREQARQWAEDAAAAAGAKAAAEASDSK